MIVTGDDFEKIKAENPVPQWNPGSPAEAPPPAPQEIQIPAQKLPPKTAEGL